MNQLIKKMYPILQTLRRLPVIIIYNIFKIFFKCDEKKILITSNTKDKLYGNLLYIYEGLQDYDYKVNIILMENPNKIKTIFYDIKILYFVATSKYIMIDDFFPLMYVLKIRKEAKLIQVWHALGAFKRVGFSRTDNCKNKKSISHKNYTATIVSSEDIIENYAEAFGISTDKVYPIGVPRTDLFFNKEIIQNKKEKIYDEYPELKNKRIILFAPTFRGSGRKSAFYPEEYINLDNIYKTLKENEIFIVKLHPFIKNQIQIKDIYKNKILDLTDYRDINDLILITDLLITDYSSVIFEYAFMKKPLIFYVPDLNEYSNARSFYYPYSEYIYGDIAKTQDELMEKIHNSKIDNEKLHLFKKKFLNKCDGNSTKRFIETLILN